MNETTPKVGMRIRAIREQRKLSLRALAAKCKLSVNAIGMIERAENSPTVSSLHSLARALEVNIVDFFEEPQEHSTVFVRKDQRLRSSGTEVVMESLGYGIRNQQLEPFFVIVRPGDTATSTDVRPATPDGIADTAGSTDDLVEHPGQEFVYCLRGEVEYEVAGRRYTLAEGDSILFDAMQPHRFRNRTGRVTELILVFQAAEGTQLARERHLNR